MYRDFGVNPVNLTKPSAMPPPSTVTKNVAAGRFMK